MRYCCTLTCVSDIRLWQLHPLTYFIWTKFSGPFCLTYCNFFQIILPRISWGLNDLHTLSHESEINFTIKIRPETIFKLPIRNTCWYTKACFFCTAFFIFKCLSLEFQSLFREVCSPFSPYLFLMYLEHNYIFAASD